MNNKTDGAISFLFSVLGGQLFLGWLSACLGSCSETDYKINKIFSLIGYILLIVALIYIIKMIKNWKNESIASKFFGFASLSLIILTLVTKIN